MTGIKNKEIALTGMIPFLLFILLFFCAPYAHAQSADPCVNFAAMIDNYKDARPIAGVNEADAVFEFPVEGGITRLMTIYKGNTSIDEGTKIGPIRSARPYFARTAGELEAVYAHAGGSANALAGLAAGDYNVIDMDALKSSAEDYFWRDNSLAMPHNLFTSIGNLKAYRNQTGCLSGYPAIWPWTFSNNPEETGMFSQDEIAVDYAGSDYDVKWVYDQTNQVYKRQIKINGTYEFDIDANGLAVTAKNIAIQYADTEPSQEIAKIDGRALMCRNGKCQNGYWASDGLNEMIQFYDFNYKQFVFSSGSFWINVTGNRYFHDIKLNTGWNVVSTPRLVEQHHFSASETSSNFDVFALNPASVSGWSTLQDLGQNEFTPLYGYFIDNKTGQDQTLTFNYRRDVDPNERLFARSIEPGWNVLGAANPSYALYQHEGAGIDRNNVKNILTSISQKVDSIVDLTADQMDKSSVAIGDNWAAKVYNDANILNDWRDTKAYAVYINSPCTYHGFQNNDPILTISSELGTITMSSVTKDTTATAQFGEDNVLLGGFTLAAANEPVIWESAMLKNGGTNNEGIVSNMRLEIDGDVVAEGVSLVDKYVTFDLGNYVIAKNDFVSVEIYGDIGIANVGNTVNLYIANASDFIFSGQDYGYGILMDSATDTNNDNVDDNIDASGDGITVTLSSGDFMTIDMDKSATPARDVRPGDTNAVLATIKMTSNGENATTDGISGASENFTISGTGLMCNEFDQAEMYDVDSQALYDLTVASGTTANTCTLTTDEEISFTKGVTKTFQVRVDLQGPNDSYTIDSNDTLKVTLKSGAFTLTGDESDASITNITPSSVSGAIITVKTASLTWSTTPLTAKTVVTGASDVTVYKASLKVGASSDVTLTSVRLDVDDTEYMSFRDTNFSQLSMYLNDKLLKSLSNKIINDGMTTGYINFTSLDSTNRVIDAGTTATLEVKANFSGNFTGTTTALEIGNSASSIVVKDKDSNAFAETVANVGTDSRKITLASVGTLKVELKVDDAKANDDTYLLAGTETAADHYLGELVFTTANEPIKVKTLVLQQVGSADSSDFIVARLYDEDGVMIAQEGPDSSGNVNFDTLDLELPADQATSYFVGVVSKGINVDGDPTSTATHGHTVKFTLAKTSVLTGLGLTANQAVTAEGVNSGDTVTCDEATSATVATGEYAAWGYATTTVSTVSGSVLTSISNNLADGVLKQGSDKTIGKYTFVFDNGSNRTLANEALRAELVQLKLTVATTSGLSVSDIKAYIDGFPSNIATSTPNAAHSVWIFGANQFADNLNEAGLVDGTVDLVITGDVTVTGATNNYLQTSINNLDGDGSDFTYNGNNGTGTNFSDLLLDIITLDGATLAQ